MAKKTRKAYEEFLNSASPEQGSPDWIIGGVIRMAYMWQSKYGTALRKYDKIGFEVGFNEWKKNE
jgi:hypothetical protein